MRSSGYASSACRKNASSDVVHGVDPTFVCLNASGGASDAKYYGRSGRCKALFVQTMYVAGDAVEGQISRNSPVCMWKSVSLSKTHHLSGVMAGPSTLQHRATTVFNIACIKQTSEHLFPGRKQGLTRACDELDVANNAG